MKQTLITFIITGAFLTIMAFSKPDDKVVGAIGDVKYSVLSPDKFKEENGSGWVLMDDKIPLQNCDLNTKHGISLLPDARGLFIRGLNLKRNDEKADPYLRENNIERLVGDYQTDMLKEHTHNYTSGKFNQVSGKGSASQFAWDPQEYTSKPTGGVETRPKNIALYIYVKINQ
ncbi:hypothetical protein GKZ90_0001165 [Flavobacterium sp. MC2016-06]|jgi:hypothetical protein|uniref:hypothetical protein n=1 Tax=Flavobacterium sp. MC2016-06 TaxID=2676308 RepID=UPI0012BAFDF9|nr:hypothetical protein [Flavobacterium sp. MC2016-06]MBU3859079.1 hypothetical protein [Flavobacterium sp. MC2016-06]